MLVRYQTQEFEGLVSIVLKLMFFVWKNEDNIARLELCFSIVADNEAFAF